MPAPDITADALRDAVETIAPDHRVGDRLSTWMLLARIARADLPLVKLVEPHVDALTILADLDGPTPAPGSVWAVWAAEPPTAAAHAREVDGGWSLTGTKAYCSGAALVTHALMTCETTEGSRLFAVDLASPGFAVDLETSPWAGPGMSRAGTHSVTLDEVAGHPVGGPGDYTARPGFWHGAIGIAACWLGGAAGVADALEKAAPRLDDHGLAHLGAVRARLQALTWVLEQVAILVDGPDPDGSGAERAAQVVRAVAADTVDEVLRRVGRALGPAPLAFDGPHAHRVADLQVFVRQHHAERDLERLGRQVVSRG